MRRRSTYKSSRSTSSCDLHSTTTHHRPGGAPYEKTMDLEDVNTLDRKKSSRAALHSSVPTAIGVSIPSPTSKYPSDKNRPRLRNRISKARSGTVLFLTTISPTGLFSREHIAAQIRKLCRHDETTISQRHSTHLSVDRMTDADKKMLEQLCKMQLDFAHRYTHVNEE